MTAPPMSPVSCPFGCSFKTVRNGELMSPHRVAEMYSVTHLTLLSVLLPCSFYF